MIPQSFQIRDFTVRLAAVLALTAGVTDTLFRRKFFPIDTVTS
jgi:hypothetical protein